MSYDQYQTVFALSTLANWVSTPKGTAVQLQAAYQAVLQNTLASQPAKDAIGSWELVWGPQVWQMDGSDLSENAMFVAKASDVGAIAGDVYVVAIAATNPNSLYDWLIEDFNVVPVVDFSHFNPLDKSPPTRAVWPWAPNVPFISMGTALGVWHLLQMVSPAKAMAPGKSLCDFLQSVAHSDATVIFAGHSLGGALSPTMAFWLKNANKLSGYKAVYCYPTAGATPGNGVFAQAYAKALPAEPSGATGYQSWNCDLWNTLDAVPHAWRINMLGDIKTKLYGNVSIPDVNHFVDFAIASSLASRIGYAQIPNQSLPGKVSGDKPSDFRSFMNQVRIQHTDAYETLIAAKLQPVLPPSHALQTTMRDSEAQLDALAARMEAEREELAERFSKAREALGVTDPAKSTA